MKGTVFIEGTAAGPLLFADLGLSFMGGVDPSTGVVTDTHHPLRGQSITGNILAIPSGRGSCAGSLVIFELLTNGHAPKAFLFRRKEVILTLGVMIANELMGLGIPIVCLEEEDFNMLGLYPEAIIQGRTISVFDGSKDFQLSHYDQACLDGKHGEAVRVATRIVIRAAQLEGSNTLIDVDMAHIDGNFYQGPGSLLFARRLVDMSAHVKIPSTMNAICIDRKLWRDQGVLEALGLPSEELAECYVKMGVRGTYTCAPYLLDEAPLFGQQIAWGESNAVVFANSVLGARTLKYPDYLDILVAITGRAPYADCHVTSMRKATTCIVVSVAAVDDSFWPLLGYHVGKIATNDIPVICGLANLTVDADDLRAFGAAFATTSAAAMFHIVGITPEASTVEEACLGQQPTRHVEIGPTELEETWRELNTSISDDVDLIALGNPHFSLTEIGRLAYLCMGKRIALNTSMVVTCGETVFEKASKKGFVQTINDFGGTFLNDTCWCLIGEPVVERRVKNIVTNSGKYAHYGPAAVQKGFHFGSLERCVDAACTGSIDRSLPIWLLSMK
ncbi:hypothetical protein BU25DRAFT_387845 [Macroventuria anomochaeta]|uniref:Uncharacterized protein n=1 Tax=Macroventuria anomochaeta TaxID=301207 RepID=A0ACB6S8M2_9PLEO|nr:uncharacterized protein BU25DRAFT_387845 [Macroventuria anomochaeta]KAF2630556.1 hypothetical protein BU25DRAFT_387845 [Macroventuria anomochaeta]